MEVIKMKFSVFIEGIPALIALLFLIFIFLVIIWLISKFLTLIYIITLKRMSKEMFFIPTHITSFSFQPTIIALNQIRFHALMLNQKGMHNDIRQKEAVSAYIAKTVSFSVILK